MQCKLCFLLRETSHMTESNCPHRSKKKNSTNGCFLRKDLFQGAIRIDSQESLKNWCFSVPFLLLAIRFLTGYYCGRCSTSTDCLGIWLLGWEVGIFWEHEEIQPICLNYRVWRIIKDYRYLGQRHRLPLPSNSVRLKWVHLLHWRERIP